MHFTLRALHTSQLWGRFLGSGFGWDGSPSLVDLRFFVELFEPLAPASCPIPGKGIGRDPVEGGPLLPLPMPPFTPLEPEGLGSAET